jgi:hypothetical protein
MPNFFLRAFDPHGNSIAVPSAFNFPLSAAGEPISGSAGTGIGVADGGAQYIDTDRKVTYYNETNASSPFWTPHDLAYHPNLLAFVTDFRDGVGKALDDAAASLLLPCGVRVHGQGIEEADSGMVVSWPEGGARATLTVTNEDAHGIALSAAAALNGAPAIQPDREGPLVVEALLRIDTALTLRRLFLGFLGTVPEALDPPATGATTTITLVQDDMAGLFFDAGLTAATMFCAIRNKSDAAASQTVAATSTGVVCPAADTAFWLRVEIGRDGTMYCFINKVLVATVAGALDVDEEVAPVLYLGSTSAATKAMSVHRFAAWCRNAN